MPSAPYIPASDPGFDTWLNNLVDLIAANPTNYGLVAGDATAMDTVRDAWNTAYALLANPLTNNSPNVAAKDVARVNAEFVVRPYCQRIRANASVSDALKVGLGLNLRPVTTTPIPPPATFPILGLRSLSPLASIHQYQDSGLGSGKAKPYGSVQVQIVATVANAPAVDPSAALYKATVTKSPFSLQWAPAQQGDTATIWARYITRSGPAGEAQHGNWSAPLSFIIA